ncbi:MAG: TIM barrel protein [Candidatus Hydrogenedentes bacterium]|nr:TIM barrel protein [Candidatus Hydrogenedentota bacterium]
MDRRTFLASGAAVAGSLSFLNAAAEDAKPAAPAADKVPAGAFKNAKVKLSFPPGLIDGTFDEQIKRISELGVPGYETLRPHAPFDETRKKTDALGLECSCIVGAGAISPGGMVNPDDHAKLVEDFKKNVEIATIIGCKRLVGLTGNTRTDISPEEQTKHIVSCLKKLAPIAEQNKMTIVMEALNTLVDHKGYFLDRSALTFEILKAVSSPNVKMLFDVYHMQISEGNVIANITKNIDSIGHFHVADNPGRHEPGTGELNYQNIFKAIAATKYEGFVAMEFGALSDKESAVKAVLRCATWA